MNGQMVVWNLIYLAAIAIGLALFAFVFASTRKSVSEDKPQLDVGAWKKRENAWLYVVIAGLIVMALFTIVEQQLPWQASAQQNRVVVQVKAQQFGFAMSESKFQVGRQIEFHVESVDVTHGFAVYDPDGVFVTQAQSLPKYATLVRMTPKKPGTYEVRCFEYCGAAHHLMKATFEVTN